MFVLSIKQLGCYQLLNENIYIGADNIEASAGQTSKESDGPLAAEHHQHKPAEDAKPADEATPAAKSNEAVSNDSIAEN